jgi:hypothetical protein
LKGIQQSGCASGVQGMLLCPAPAGFCSTPCPLACASVPFPLWLPEVSCAQGHAGFSCSGGAGGAGVFPSGLLCWGWGWSDFASGRVVGRVCLRVLWLPCVWVTAPLSDSLLPISNLPVLSEPETASSSTAASFPAYSPDLASDASASLRSSQEQGNIAGGGVGWICVRWSQTMLVTTRPPLAFGAGLASSLSCWLIGSERGFRWT